MATDGTGSPDWLDDVRLQLAGVGVALLVVASWHWANDGLWFQGDAPRHAVTGLFLWIC